MNKAVELVWLIPALPFIGFLLNGLGRKVFSKPVISLIACGTILGSFILSIIAFSRVVDGGAGVVDYFTFINAGSFNIPFSFQIDSLSTLFLLIITGVGFLIHVYSTSYMNHETQEHFGRYFAYLNLFVFSMLLLVMGSNFVIMFIGWEGVGLCSYLLIGYWFRNTEYNWAAKKAFVMNRIGDLGFLIAIFWILGKTGTVSFNEVFAFAEAGRFSGTDITAITILLFIGATGKSAQIPLYTWLPDAMAGPTPVSALIHAATMVTAGIYMIARSNVLYSLAPLTQTVVIIIGLSTALLAATIALRQNDIKKVLAYSTVSQLGYMFLALGTGAYIAAVFHVMTHAFFKALLFLGSGSVIHALGGEQDIQRMGGLRKKMKITSITFLIGCLAIAGIPPLSGFFSKDSILLSAFTFNHTWGPVIYSLALLGALLTAFYMFRLYFLTFSGSFRGTQEQAHHLHESPAAMTIPLIVLAILSIIGGFVGIPEALIHGGDLLTSFLSSTVSFRAHDISHSTEYALMGISTVLILVVIFMSWRRYRSYREEKRTGITEIFYNKWYVDELYDKTIVMPLKKLGGVFNTVVERSGIDAIVNGFGRLVQYSSRQLRLLQSGQVGSYILLMVVSMLILFVFQFFIKS